MCRMGASRAYMEVGSESKCSPGAGVEFGSSSFLDGYVQTKSIR